MVFLIKYRNIVIASLVFLLAVSIASLGLAIIVRKFRYKKESSELYVGLAMLIGGLLAAIFTTEIAQYGLVAIGALFVVFGIILIVNHAGKKAWFYMSLGIVPPCHRCGFDHSCLHQCRRGPVDTSSFDWYCCSDNGILISITRKNKACFAGFSAEYREQKRRIYGICKSNG